ncbi:AMP-binding protein [Paenibacillus sp. HB172176]|uniref:phenylacetate--CoA ligase family protein n=1 Tax=Paenibacillus sp. HB172176 TaxID=2493690 RepID=UPI00143CB808|nr:AMP-binding protein [Paenibacillus sp. HB172176]
MIDCNPALKDRFEALIARLAHSPLYKEKLASIDRNRLELNQLHSLPLTTKEELRNAGTYGSLAVNRRQISQYHESTGTTGIPSASWFTQADLRTGGQQVMECDMQLNAEDSVLIRFPYALALPAFLMQEAARGVGAEVVPASGRTVVTPYPRVLDLMKRLDVTILAGLPREMELLAEAARLLGLVDFPSLRAICVAGELMSARRKRHIEKLWGVPVYNLYGSTETANIAVMCEHGEMHVAQQDFIVEALSEDGSHSVDPGERGFAAITTLSHQGSPLLRYFNEDIISIDASSNCGCGRLTNKLTHFGRGMDRIRIGDKVLDAFDIQEAVYSLSPVPDAWKVFERENGLHVLLDSHHWNRWNIEDIRSILGKMLQVPVTVGIVHDSMLLNRNALMDNTPSIKPVYIQKRIRGNDQHESKSE